MTIAAPSSLLESVLGVLVAEEEQLARLLQLALDEQKALVTSNFDALEEVNAHMLELAAGLDDLERQRAEILSGIDADVDSLDQLVPLAEDLGVTGFDEARERLIYAAVRLQQAQESNAQLILAAMKLSERWVNLAAGLGSPTYGAAGKQRLEQARGLMSRSA